MSRCLLPILLVAAVAASAAAEETWRLDASGSTYSYVCGGSERISVNGKGNTLTVTGECGVLEVAGSDNKITIEAVASIVITGNNNDVRYTRALNAKKRPVIKLKGAANTVRRRS